jgi:hypothetical protein
VITKLARLGFGVAALALVTNSFALAETSATPATTTTTVAQASPSPKPSADPFTYRGYVRAYDFTRQNAYSGLGSKPNQSTFSSAVSLHGDYSFIGSGFDIGATYLYGTPFGACSDPASHFPQANSNTCAGAGFSGTGGNSKVYQDDTIPGFSLSTLYEAYAHYSGNGLNIIGGNLVGDQVWAPASDSRLKPAAYTGAEGSYTFQNTWTVAVGDYWQWECRTCSAFDKYTLLTDGNLYPYSGANALQSWNYDPAQAGVPNNGVLFGRVGYKGPTTLPLTVNVSYYAFDKIANLLWIDASLPFSGKLKPFVKAQFGSEGNATNYSLDGVNTGILGAISNTTFGMQAGFNPWHSLQLVAGFDSMPWKTATLTAAQAAGIITCSNSTHQVTAVSKYKVNLPYFLPTSGPAQCTKLADGSIDLYYGGLASPYTDSYATDPLFTTSLTRGMVDQRAAGNSYKVAAIFTSDDKQFVGSISQAWYDYNNAGYALGANETDLDMQYFFKKIPKAGPYKGFSFRYRYGSRSYPVYTSTQGGLFKYNRFQAEYDF